MVIKKRSHVYCTVLYCFFFFYNWTHKKMKVRQSLRSGFQVSAVRLLHVCLSSWTWGTSATVSRDSETAEHAVNIFLFFSAARMLVNLYFRSIITEWNEVMSPSNANLVRATLGLRLFLNRRNNVTKFPKVHGSLLDPSNPNSTQTKPTLHHLSPHHKNT